MLLNDLNSSNSKVHLKENRTIPLIFDEILGILDDSFPLLNMLYIYHSYLRPTT